MSILLRRRILSLEKTASLWPQGVIRGLRLTIKKMWPATSGSEVNVVQMNEFCFSSGLEYKSQIYQYPNGVTYTSANTYDSSTSTELPNKAVNNTLTGDKMCIHIGRNSYLYKNDLTTLNNYLATSPAVITWNFPEDSNFTGEVYKNLFFITGNDSDEYASRTPREFTLEVLSDDKWYLVFDYAGTSETVPSNLRQSDMGVILVENGNAISSSYRIDDVLSWEDGDVEEPGEIEGESSGSELESES